MTEPPPLSSPSRILVVEDNPLTRKMLRVVLELEGFEVDDAGDGASARVRAAAHPPDLLILDYVLPDTDGVRLLEDIRRAHGAIPALLLTGMALPDSVRAGMARDALPVLTKPVEPAELAAHVRAALRSQPGGGDAGLDRLAAELGADTSRRAALLRHAAAHASALTVLRGLSAFLARPDDVVSVIGEVMLQALDAAGSPIGLLYVLDENGAPRLCAQAGVPGAARAAATTFFGEPGVLLCVLQSGETLSLSARDGEAHPAMLDALGVRSAIIVPFLAGEQRAGAVVLAAGAHDVLDPAWRRVARGIAREFGEAVTLGHSLALLTHVAQHAGVAIENLHLVETVDGGRARLETLARSVVDVQEDERSAIARELHDDIGQMLTSLTIMLETRARVHPEANLAPLQDLVGQLLERVRNLSQSLRPPMLDDFGLAPTLAWLCQRLQEQTGIDIRFRHRDADRRFGADREIAVFRIAQEALTNVARHAGVSVATVELWATPDVLGVQIDDAGAGFDPAQSFPLSSGLTNMRQRAELAGGRLRITSRPGEGTRVWCELPLHIHATPRTRPS